MKTFKQFIAEADSYSQVTDGSSYGGGMSTADIDARTDLTPAQKAKLRARKTRVPGQNIRGTTPPAGGAPKPPATAPAGGGGTPPKPGAIVSSPGGKIVKSTAKAAAGGAAQGGARDAPEVSGHRAGPSRVEADRRRVR